MQNAIKFNSRNLLFYFLLMIATGIHTYNLYPFLSLSHIGLQTLLRLFLTLAPLLYVYTMNITQNQLLIKFTKVFSVILLPYTLYNIFQIRHITEQFRLEENQYFAPDYADQSWQLIFTFLYGFLSLFIFFECLNNLTGDSKKKQFWLILLIIYSSCASIFGLFTRINVWELNSLSQYSKIANDVVKWSFPVNILILSGMTFILYTLWDQRTVKT